jgi:hypothetical protein
MFHYLYKAKVIVLMYYIKLKLKCLQRAIEWENIAWNSELCSLHSPQTSNQ